MPTAVDIVIFVLGFLLSTLMALVAYIFNDMRKQVRADIIDLREDAKKDTAEVKEQVKINGKHLDSLMQTVWTVNWRTAGVEDYLADFTRGTPNRFRPPRIIGDSETGGKGV